MNQISQDMEPWNLKSSDERTFDSLLTFIIFCEDEVSEPIYFKYFETPLIKVNPIGGQKSKMKNVITAISHCFDRNMFEEVDGLHILKRSETQVWCVFDRDVENQVSTSGNVEFNEAIDTATSKGIKVAWSNDAFELWILLHFEDVPINQVTQHRSYYYSRLTDIFKRMETENTDLSDALKYSGFSYERDLKRKNNFRNIVRREAISLFRDAIARAKNLETLHGKISLFHKKSPCTTVHHLVEELINFGRKGT